MKQLMFAWCLAVSMMAFADDFLVETNGTVVTVTPQVSSGTTFSDTFLAPAVSKAIFSTEKYQYSYAPSGVPTYAGGTELLGGQMHVRRGDIFGSGNVVLGAANKAALMANGADVTITNKVVFNHSNSYAMGYNDGGMITLKSVGTKVDGLRTIRLGRENAGAVSKAVLSLTDPSSEALNRINLQGACVLSLDGGTIKVLSTVNNPFFNVSTAGDLADISVTTNGVTFDVPANAVLYPGQPLKFPSEFPEIQQSDILETARPENWDFEGSGGWTFTCYGDTSSGIKTSPTHWDGQGAYPPNNKCYAMLRKNTVLSTSMEIATEGFWRVSFLRGRRPPDASSGVGYSGGMAMHVIVDGVTNETFGAVSWPYESSFTNLKTTPFKMVPGSHTIAFEVFDVGNNPTTYSLNVDAVELERVGVSPVCGTLAKSGDGCMVLTGQDLAGVPVVVADGTLLLDNVTLGDDTVAVLSGATVEIENAEIDGAVNVSDGGTNVLRNVAFTETAVVSVAAGGVLNLSDFGTNLVINGSFEQDGPKTYAAGTIPTGWKWILEENLGSINDNGGLQGNGGTLSSSGPYTPADSVTAFLREACSFIQTNNCITAGRYRVSLLTADRKHGHSEQVPIYVKIDGETVITVPARESYSDYVRHFADVELAVGKHEIKIQTGKANTPALGNIVFVDDVRVRLIEPLGAINVGEIRLAAGAELNLDLVNCVDVANVWVNGVKVRGGNAALTRAGVIITDSGKIQAGARRGISIGFK